MESYLSFKLANDSFSINVSKILEILEVPFLTKLPEAPKFLLGVMNLRTEAIPVVDLRVLFDMETSEKTVNTSVLVLDINIDGKPVKIGGLVDSVNKVFDLDKGDIKPAPRIKIKDYLIGMIQEDDNFNMILDVDSIFTEEEKNNFQ